MVKADLLQLGEVKKQLRFVVLTESALLVFDESVMGPEKKVISKDNMQVKSVSDLVLHITCNDTLHVFVMRSSNHKNEWLDALIP